MVGEFEFSKDEKKEMMVGDFLGGGPRRCNDRDATALSVRTTLTFLSANELIARW